MRRGESSKMRTCARQAGVCRLSFACASLQPFDESSGSGKLEPQAEEIDLSLQAQLATSNHDKTQWRLWSIMEAVTKKGVCKKKPLK
jgi:hypothetical protein